MSTPATIPWQDAVLNQTLERLGRQLGQIGLSLSVYDPSSTVLTATWSDARRVCRLCGAEGPCACGRAEQAEAIGSDGQARVLPAPTGCTCWGCR